MRLQLSQDGTYIQSMSYERQVRLVWKEARFNYVRQNAQAGRSGKNRRAEFEMRRPSIYRRY